jgi:predicted AlkP superfamily pyrophosphatase or phosphodiesterase
MSRRGFLFFLGACAALLAGCATRPVATPAPLVLISLDAFRWDYCALYPAETPNLQRLMREGVTAKSLIPAFPSNTFSNHYSIVTGMYPARHGIINNTMFEPASGLFFRYNQSASSRQSHWWGGEPIWSTAIKQGGLGGAWFWPGSEAEIGGIRPTLWQPYDASLRFETRLDSLVEWLGRVRRQTPVVATFYFEEINSIGHKFGPGSPELGAALKVADAQIGQMQARLQAAGIAPNFVIVSDHGMTPISVDRILLLDDFIAPDDVQVDFDGPVAGLRPLKGDETSLLRALGGVKNAKVYRAADLPARYRMRDNPRIPPVWIVPEEGWEIYFRSRFETYRGNFNKGDHGYDPAFPSMHGIFIAHGPAFRRGAKIPATENIHIYNLLCAALNIRPAPNDGDNRLARAALAR